MLRSFQDQRLGLRYLRVMATYACAITASRYTPCIGMKRHPIRPYEVARPAGRQELPPCTVPN